ncbi:MAG: hypothetical protein GJU76_00240 [Gallionella sp.]|jgi:DNA-binding phage protein|nr:hypothetical protein [Gallionella sp.]
MHTNRSEDRNRKAPGDSTDWSAEQKAQAGQAAANLISELHRDPAYRAALRRGRVASNLAVLVAGSGLSRSKVAERAKMKLPQLTRALGDEPNLTLDTISRICEAAGFDFDVVFRKVGERRALQPWEQSQDLRSLTAKLIRRVGSSKSADPQSSYPWQINLSGAIEGHHNQVGGSPANDHSMTSSASQPVLAA